MKNTTRTFFALLVCTSLGFFFLGSCDEDMNVRALQLLPVHMVTNDVATAVVSGDTVQVVFSNLTTTLATNFYPSASNPSNYTVQGEGIPADWVNTNFFTITQPALNSNQLSGIGTNIIRGVSMTNDFLATNHVPNAVIPRQIVSASRFNDPFDMPNQGSPVYGELICVTVNVDRASLLWVSANGIIQATTNAGQNVYTADITRDIDGVGTSGTVARMINSFDQPEADGEVRIVSFSMQRPIAAGAGTTEHVICITGTDQPVNWATALDGGTNTYIWLDVLVY